MRANTSAPRRLATLFAAWMPLLRIDASAYAASFTATSPPPTLAQIAAEVDRLRAAADAIRSACSDDVRTGVGGVLRVNVAVSGKGRLA